MILKYRYLISFIFTLFLYILLLFLALHFYQKKDFQKFSQKESHSFKMNLKNFVLPRKSITPKVVKKTKKNIKKEKIVKKKKVIKRLKKHKKIIKHKKIVKKIAKKIKKKRIKKVVSKEQNITKKLVLDKKREQQKAIKKVAIQKKQQEQKSLISFLKKPQLPSLQKISKTMDNKEIEKLYKGEFDSFTKGQKEFIKKNLSLIGKITQKYLTNRGYPYFAAKTGQEGVNIVQFYLYPNGDIKDLKIIKSSGYETLDQNSIDTILEAYKDYPRPKEKTKIRVFVRYDIIY